VAVRGRGPLTHVRRRGEQAAVSRLDKGLLKEKVHFRAASRGQTETLILIKRKTGNEYLRKRREKCLPSGKSEKGNKPSRFVPILCDKKERLLRPNRFHKDSRR